MPKAQPPTPVIPMGRCLTLLIRFWVEKDSMVKIFQLLLTPCVKILVSQVLWRLRIVEILLISIISLGRLLLPVLKKSREIRSPLTLREILSYLRKMQAWRIRNGILRIRSDSIRGLSCLGRIGPWSLPPSWSGRLGGSAPLFWRGRIGGVRGWLMQRSLRTGVASSGPARRWSFPASIRLWKLRQVWDPNVASVAGNFYFSYLICNN